MMFQNGSNDHLATGFGILEKADAEKAVRDKGNGAYCEKHFKASSCFAWHGSP